MSERIWKKVIRLLGVASLIPLAFVDDSARCCSTDYGYDMPDGGRRWRIPTVKSITHTYDNAGDRIDSCRMQATSCN